MSALPNGRAVKCRNCKQTLTNPQRRPFEVWCSSDCAVAIWRAKEAKKQAQELRKRREAIKLSLIHI